jgi:methionine aminotransferase
VGAKLSQFFGAKRDRLVAALSDCGLVLPQSEGSFFLLIDYGAISTARDIAFADELLTQAGVATIPVSVFYDAPPPSTLLRLCFAKRDETLDEGAARLATYLRSRERRASPERSTIDAVPQAR